MLILLPLVQHWYLVFITSFSVLEGWCASKEDNALGCQSGEQTNIGWVRGKAENIEDSHLSASSDVQVKDNVHGSTKKNPNQKESFVLLFLEILSNVHNPSQITLNK